MEYTKEEYKEFEELVDLTSSTNQMDRIKSRLRMGSFIEKTGKEKCDFMYLILTKDD